MKKLNFHFTTLHLFTLLVAFLLLVSFTSCESGPKTREEKIQEMVENINNTPEWIGGLKNEAEAKKRPLDSLVLEAATFMVDKQDGGTLSHDERIDKVKKNIMATPDWLAGLKKSAETQKRPLDSVIVEAANWMLDEEDGKHAQPASAAPAAAPAAK